MPSGLSSDPFDQVHLSVRATVAGEEVFAQMTVPPQVWDDPGAREAITESLRFKLVTEILKKWTPKIIVRR